MLALRWNLDKPFSMSEPPAEYKGFLSKKRLQALQLGGPAALVGALVASLAAGINGELAAVVPTLQGCGIVALISFVISQVAKRLEK